MGETPDRDGHTVSEALAKRKRHPEGPLTRPDPPGKVRAFRLA
jgi:hypothetical protein